MSLSTRYFCRIIEAFHYRRKFLKIILWIFSCIDCVDNANSRFSISSGQETKKLDDRPYCHKELLPRAIGVNQILSDNKQQVCVAWVIVSYHHPKIPLALSTSHPDLYHLNTTNCGLMSVYLSRTFEL